MSRRDRCFATLNRLIVVTLTVGGLGLRASAADELTGKAMSVLKAHCVSCHNPEKKKGGLSLLSREAMLAGGESGTAVVVGKAEKSRLAEVLLPDVDGHMPPKGQLEPEEIRTVRAWIDAGAKWDEKVLVAQATTRPVKLRALPAAYSPVLAMAVSPDQKRLAVGRGERLVVYDLSGDARAVVGEMAAPAGEAVYALGWSGDGRFIAAGGYRTVRVWDAKTLKVAREIEGLGGRVTALTFVGKEAALAAAEGDVAGPAKVGLWDAASGKELGRWAAHADSILTMRASADGKYLATGGADKVAKVWELPAGKELAKLEGHAGPVMAVAWSADGAQLATAGSDKEIKVWAVKTRDQAASLATSPTPVTDLSWVGKQVLSASEDGIVRLSTEANKTRADRTFAAAPDVLYNAIATDQLILAGCHDGNVYAWEAKTGKALGALGGADSPQTRGERGGGAEKSQTEKVVEGQVSFVRDVMPILVRAGCSAGACHAKPAGQNGFKLSVFGYDSKADYAAIVKDARGRRVFPAAPEESLILKKPTMAVEHGGGMKLQKGSAAYGLLLKWLEQGMPYAVPGEPTLAGVEVSPKGGRYAKGATQKLKVAATYSDGSVRDVTHLAEFASNEPEVAKPDEHGSVRVGTLAGEAVVVGRYMGLVDVSRVTVPTDQALPAETFAKLPVANYVDSLVYERLKELAIAPSGRCTDEEFLRRASLDIAGALPTPDEARKFLADIDPDKRNKLVDRLLESPTFADHWANKWGDLLRPNPFRAGVKGVYLFDQWIRDSFRQNKPLDQFAKEILTAQGSTHRYGPAVFFRDRREPTEITTFVSQVFLGLRLECAKCHHHPSEKWKQEDFYQFAAFFGQIKRKGQGISAPISGEAEFIWTGASGKGEVKHPVTGETMKPKAPDAPLPTMAEGQDPRGVLADWVTNPGNPFFARATANRVWNEMLGRGIVHPVDDFRVSNPPVNGPLLDALAKDLAEHKYDLKHLVRTIARSNVYQLSSIPNQTNAADGKNFSRYYRKRPAAEVALDAVCDVTGVPENLGGLAPGSRATQVWNNRLDSEFLDAFGRPNPSADPPCERERTQSIVQALHLMNSSKLTAKIASPAGRAAKLAEGKLTPEQIVEELYLAAYSRLPNEAEKTLAVGAFAAEGATRKSAVEDVMWALINSAEFVFNH